MTLLQFVSILVFTATIFLSGYYAAKTINSRGGIISGWAEIVMKLTPIMFFASVVLNVISFGWYTLLFIAIFFPSTFLVKALLLRIIEPH